MSNLTDRMLRAARLDPSLYEEVEADGNAMPQAMSVVIIASVAAALGVFQQVGIFGVMIMTIGALLGWLLWAYLTFLIGTKLLPAEETRADLGQLLRTTGFAAAPGVLRLFAFIPVLGPLIAMLAQLWMLAAMVVAVRQALDYVSTGRALLVCVVGFLAQAAVLGVIFLALS